MLPPVRVSCLFFPFCKRTLLTPRKPPDSLFLFDTYLPSDRLVAKVTGVLPTTPRNFKGEPKIQEWETYDVRYHSFSTMGKSVTLFIYLEGEGERASRSKSQRPCLWWHLFLPSVPALERTFRQAFLASSHSLNQCS
jgi:hypothetical protein